MNKREEASLRDAMFDDVTLLPVTILIVDAWQLFNMLRLASEFPHLKAIHRHFARIGEIFQNAIVSRYPNTRLAFQRGMGRGAFEKRASAALADTVPLELTIPICDAYITVLAVQLVIRHPGMAEDLRRRLINVGRQFQGSVLEIHPGAETMLERGWDTRFDVDSEAGQ